MSKETAEAARSSAEVAEGALGSGGAVLEAGRGGGYAHEARLLVRLAVPVAVARVGMLTMGLVDTWMVGKLGAVELASVALADACFFTLLVVVVGTVRALDPLVSQAHGAGNAERCAAAWRGGLRLGFALSIPLTLAVLAIPALLATSLFAQDARVVESAGRYLGPIALGVLPQIFFAGHASFVQGLGDTRPPMIATLLANLLNVVLDYGLIFGHWGLPALGVSGAGIASTCSRWFMCLLLWAWILRSERYAPYRVRVAVPARLLWQALRLGVPIGLAHAAEVGAFSLASIFMGWLSVAALAAHQIAIKMAATTFMLAVALGIATGIRVGNEIGAGHPWIARRAAFVAVGLVLLVMGVCGLGFVRFGGWIVSGFTQDPAVIAIGTSLLGVAAAFQLSDGVQAVASGAVRGAGDTLYPLTVQIVAHWGVAIPLAWVFAFRLGWGPVGVWVALALGLTVAAALLLWPLRKLDRVEAIAS
ncbi:MAG: MATE family efflux transporter [Planctomycetota bacterium]